MARIDLDHAGSGATAGVTPKPSAEDLFDLGIAYAVGDEVETDLVSAHKWFNLAAMAGNREAASHRQDLALEMSPREIAAAQRAAREWMAAA